MARVDSNLRSSKKLFVALVLSCLILVLTQRTNLAHVLSVNAVAIEIGRLILADKPVSPEAIGAAEDSLRTAWDQGYHTPGTGRLLVRAREVRTGQPDVSLAQAISQRFPMDPLVQ